MFINQKMFNTTINANRNNCITLKYIIISVNAKCKQRLDIPQRTTTYFSYKRDVYYMIHKYNKHK